MSPSEARTVLLCDDEPDLLQVYRIALRSSFDVITTSSGGECIAKYSELRKAGRRVDLVILDFRLGDMAGEEVARRLRKLDDAKIVLLTAYEVDNELIARLKNEGMISAYIQKPISLAALSATIQKVIDDP